MMAYPRIWSLAIISLIVHLSPPAGADTVTLNSGEKFEGKVLLEDEKSVVVDVEVSAGIMDRKVLDRAEVASVERDSEAEKVFERIEHIKPASTSLTQEQYTAFIKTLEQFRKQFPDSDYDQVIMERITAFKAEQERAAGGEIKIKGKWMAAEEVEKKKYQITAGLLLEQMQEAVRRGDYTGALNAFDVIQKDYPGSRAYVDAVPLSQQTLRRLESDIARRIPLLENELKAREEGIAITPEPRKAGLIASGKREEKQFEAAIQAAKEAGHAWPPLISRSMKSLKMIQDQIPKAEKSLSNIPLAEMRNSLAALDAAKAALQANDFESAEANLEEARSKWKQNEEAERWQKILAEKKKAAEEEAAQTPEPEAEPSASPETTPEPKKKKTPASTPKPEKPAPGTTSAATAEENDSTPFFLTIPGAGVILGVVALAVAIISILGKVKRPEPPAGPDDQP